MKGKHKKVGLIYKIVNNKNDKLYIGQTTQTPTLRLNKHIRDALNINNREYNTKFNRAIRKYKNGHWNILILQKDIPIESLSEIERIYIFLFDTYRHGYNSTLGGEGLRGFKHSEKTKRLLAKKATGRRHTKKSKKKMSEAQKGKFVSDETKRKIGISSVGRKSSRFTGYKHSDESKKKISVALKGRKINSDISEKRSQARTGTKRIGTSIYVGVSFDRNKGKWRAKFQQKYLGLFNTEKSAALAYNRKATNKYGNKAKLNVIGINKKI